MQFSEEQQIAYEIFKSGQNMFLTGPGGTGKSAFIRHIQEESFRKGKEIQVCAMTGCAALMLECKAKTIHSWASIGLCTNTIENMITRIKRNRLAKSVWKTVDVLVVDEVSMMSQKIFETLDAIGKSIRRNNKPFGGIQLIFTGDFYQLPPVSKNRGLPDEDETTGNFCFQSSLWLETFPWENHIELVKIFRQTDLVYQKILNQIRKGALKQSSYAILLKQVGKEPPKLAGTKFKPTKLYPTRNQVNMINSAEMSNLDGDVTSFDIKLRYDLEMTKAEKNTHMLFTKEQIDKELAHLQNNLICEPTVHIKIGTQVMCIINIRLTNGDMICNGSQGIVVRFDDITNAPVVLFYRNNYEMTMDYHIWKSETIPGVGVAQIPLIHAWALTIHKSQGSTLEIAEIDAGTGIFECGQTYVALSRVKSLDGLYLSAFDPSRIRINTAVRDFYDEMEKQTAENRVKRKRVTSFSEFAYFLEPSETINVMPVSVQELIPEATEIIVDKDNENENENMEDIPVATAVLQPSN